MTVKLDFKTDFTFFLENSAFHDPVKIETESGVIKGSAALLSQHSHVLRETIKKDKKLLLTDNKHVRECLSVLYGGSVVLSEENFQDILNFMTAFDIPDARKQVLDWMSKYKWNLENVGLLVNGSMAATKVAAGKTHAEPSSLESLREAMYKPCRLFFGERLVNMVRFDSTDARYRNLASAMDCVIAGVVDKQELLALLLHKDLIPVYIPWVKMLMDQFSYDFFLKFLDRADLSNKMCLCPRAHIEELFEKIENFENITLKEFKHLNKYKIKINDRISELQSLRFMKESGNLYSCWKMLDEDGMEVLSTSFTEKSDQFCVIECLLSWISANKSSGDMVAVVKMLAKAINRLSAASDNINLKTYCKDYLQNLLSRLQIPISKYKSIAEIPPDRYIFSGSPMGDLPIGGLPVGDVTVGDIKILLKLNSVNMLKVTEPTYGIFTTKTGSPIASSGNRIVTLSDEQTDDHRANLKFIIKLFQNKIPKVVCEESIGNYHFYAYAWNVRETNRKFITTRLPLYCHPEESYKTIKQYQYCYDGVLNMHQDKGSHGLNNANRVINYVTFAILGVGF